MRRELFHIPLDRPWSLGPLGEVPVFGLGIALLVWLLCGAWWAYRGWRRGRLFSTEFLTAAFGWLLVAVLIHQIPVLGSKFLPNGIPIYGFGLMMVIGFAAAGWFAARRAPSIGVSGDAIWDLAMWVFFAGIVGARVFYVIQYHNRVFEGKYGLGLLKAAVSLPDGGLVFYGGLIGGALAYFVACRRLKKHPLLVADLIVPSVFIGLAFGRLGCLLNGCCYGDLCSLPWAIVFPQGSPPFEIQFVKGLLPADAQWSLPLHPTQIYSSLNAFALAAITTIYFKYRQRNGDVLLVGWLLYPITRFVIEFLRNDEPGQFGTTFTISQWISGGMFVAAIIYWIWLSRQPLLDEGRSNRRQEPSGRKSAAASVPTHAP